MNKHAPTIPKVILYYGFTPLEDPEAVKLWQKQLCESLNLKGAYLEVWSDMLGSLGVLIAAVVIKYTGWSVADPIVAVLIGLWVLPRTWTLLRQAGHVLMQGVPAGMELDRVRQAMQARPGVREIHDLHLWALGSQQPVMTAHIVLEDATINAEEVRIAIAKMLEDEFDIHHATLQLELVPCEDAHV